MQLSVEVAPGFKRLSIQPKGNTMTAYTKLLALAISGFAVLAMPMDASAKTRTAPHHRHYSEVAPRHWHYLEVTRGYAPRQIADGSLVDSYGWRKWPGSAGWDNTCFNLDHLPSQFACSASNG
jgi:hypothetical protein